MNEELVIPFKPSVKLLLDSVSPQKYRLTSVEVTTHRFVLAEFNTHRVFTRNSGSSRAIPFEKMLKKVLNTPALPVYWGRNQKGMQAAESLNHAEIESAVRYWISARNSVIEIAEKMNKELNLHKQIINRLLEPWLPHTMIISATEWDGFFWQRCHKDAQPEIKAAADEIQLAYYTSTPKPLYYGEWHLPYLDEETFNDVMKYDRTLVPYDTLKKVSAARCARTSYLTQDGKRDFQEDLNLYNRLVTAEILHASPLEHVAAPAYMVDEKYEGTIQYNPFSPNPIYYRLNNFKGWNQFRHEIEDRRPMGRFIPNHPLLLK